MPKDSRSTETLFNKGLYNFSDLWTIENTHCFAKGLTPLLTNIPCPPVNRIPRQLHVVFFISWLWSKCFRPRPGPSGTKARLADPMVWSQTIEGKDDQEMFKETWLGSSNPRSMEKFNQVLNWYHWYSERLMAVPTRIISLNRNQSLSFLDYQVDYLFGWNLHQPKDAVLGYSF